MLWRLQNDTEFEYDGIDLRSLSLYRLAIAPMNALNSLNPALAPTTYTQFHCETTSFPPTGIPQLKWALSTFTNIDSIHFSTTLTTDDEHQKLKEIIECIQARENHSPVKLTFKSCNLNEEIIELINSDLNLSVVKLETCGLDYNHLDLSSLTELQTENTGNALSNDKYKLSPKALLTCKKLQSLTIWDGAPDLFTVTKDFDFPHLTNLKLTNRELPLALIRDMLNATPNLESIVLENVSILKRRYENSLPPIPKLPNLKTIKHNDRIKQNLKSKVVFVLIKDTIIITYCDSTSDNELVCEFLRYINYEKVSAPLKVKIIFSTILPELVNVINANPKLFVNKLRKCTVNYEALDLSSLAFLETKEFGSDGLRDPNALSGKALSTCQALLALKLHEVSSTLFDASNTFKFPHLTKLELKYHHPSISQFRYFLTGATSLKKIELYGCRIITPKDDSTLEQLPPIPSLSQLTDFIYDTGAHECAQPESITSEFLDTIFTNALSLKKCQLKSGASKRLLLKLDVDPHTLSEACQQSNPTSVELENVEFAQDSLQYFFSHFKSINELAFRNCKFNDAQAPTTLKTPCSIRSLELSKSNLLSPALAGLLDFTLLQSLEIVNCRMTIAQLNHIWNNASKLEELKLDNVLFYQRSFFSFYTASADSSSQFKLKEQSNLHTISLISTDINAQDLSELIVSAPNLSSLSMSKSIVVRDLIRKLRAHAYNALYPKLTSLELLTTDVDEQALSDISRMFPRVSELDVRGASNIPSTNQNRGLTYEFTQLRIIKVCDAAMPRPLLKQIATKNPQLEVCFLDNLSKQDKENNSINFYPNSNTEAQKNKFISRHSAITNDDLRIMLSYNKLTTLYLYNCVALDLMNPDKLNLKKAKCVDLEDLSIVYTNITYETVLALLNSFPKLKRLTLSHSWNLSRSDFDILEAKIELYHPQLKLTCLHVSDYPVENLRFYSPTKVDRPRRQTSGITDFRDSFRFSPWEWSQKHSFRYR